MTANIHDLSKNCFLVRRKSKCQAVLKGDATIISWVCPPGKATVWLKLTKKCIFFNNWYSF